MTDRINLNQRIPCARVFEEMPRQSPLRFQVETPGGIAKRHLTVDEIHDLDGREFLVIAWDGRRYPGPVNA